MVNFLLKLLPYGTLILNALAIILFIALITRKGIGQNIVRWTGKHTLILGFFVSLAAVLGSLFYSDVVGYEPCILCWWQRIFIFPQLILFLTALKSKDRGVFKYIWRLSVLAGLVSIYNTYIQFGGNPLVPCPVNNPCTKLYVYAFHYVTIPTMALSIAVLMILLAWANKIYER